MNTLEYYRQLVSACGADPNGVFNSGGGTVSIEGPTGAVVTFRSDSSGVVYWRKSGDGRDSWTWAPSPLQAIFAALGYLKSVADAQVEFISAMMATITPRLPPTFLHLKIPKGMALPPAWLRLASKVDQEGEIVHRRFDPLYEPTEPWTVLTVGDRLSLHSDDDMEGVTYAWARHLSDALNEGR